MKRSILLLIVLSFFLGFNNSDTEDKLSYFRYGNIQELDKYLSYLKQKVKESPDLLLEEIHYPFSLYEEGELMRIYTTKAEAKDEMKNILPPKVISAIQDQKVDNIDVDYQGIIIGEGQVWLDYDDGYSCYYIKAISK